MNEKNLFANSLKGSPSPTTRPADGKRVQKARHYFATFNLLLLAASFQTITRLLDYAWIHDFCNHLLLVPFISAWLIYLRRREIDWHGEPTVDRYTVLLVVLGFAIHGLALSCGSSLGENDSVTLSTLGLVTAWIGGFRGYIGQRAFRKTLAPVAFLFFSAPIPEQVLETLVWFLQTGSTWAALGWFDLFGVPVTREGFYLSLPHVTVEVASQCSGIRSFLALCLTSIVFTHLFYRSPWMTVAAIVLSFPVSMIKNGLRIALLSKLLDVYGNTPAIALLHSKAGPLFFIVALVIMGISLMAAHKLGTEIVLLSRHGGARSHQGPLEHPSNAPREHAFQGKRCVAGEETHSGSGGRGGPGNIPED